MMATCNTDELGHRLPLQTINDFGLFSFRVSRPDCTLLLPIADVTIEGDDHHKVLHVQDDAST
jgi:hypothetical protein